MKVLSLLPSATEIVCALGLETQLVGRSHECDFPETVRALPSLSCPKFVCDGRSYQIDEKVRAVLSEGMSIYRIDIERLKELRPEVIITQVQCDVCAVSLRDLEQALGQFVGYMPKVVALNPTCLSDIFEDIRRIARCLDVEARGTALIESLQYDFSLVERRTRARNSARPKVLTLEWLNPLMSGGNWMPELLSYVQAENLCGEPGKHSPWMSFSDIATLAPEVLLLLPCGFDISRTKSELPEFFQQHPWGEVPAVQNDQVYLLDGNQYFNRSGPRIRESLFILEEILYPDGREAIYRGTGWERCNLGDFVPKIAC